MPPTFYDTHAHLDYPDFAEELPQVIARAGAAGISKIISIGTDLESSRRAIELAEQFPNVFAVVGWHPSHAGEAPPDFRPSLRELAQHRKVVALGETGLDYHRLPSSSPESKVHPSFVAVPRQPKSSLGQIMPFEDSASTTGLRRVESPKSMAAEDERYKQKQAELFRQHLEVAAELGLNCVIHQRDSLEDTIAQLQPFADRVRGVFHCFANDAATMRRILTLGSLVSFTGIVTFKNGQNVRDTLAATPMDQFMLETDCPYLAPVPYRGKRCEPAHVKEISEVAATVKGCALEDLSEKTCATANRFFRGLSE